MISRRNIRDNRNEGYKGDVTTGQVKTNSHATLQSAVWNQLEYFYWLCCEFIAGYHRAFCQKTIHQTREAVLPNPHVPRRQMKRWRWQSSFDELNNRLEYLTKTNKAGKTKSQKNLSQYRSGIQTRSWFWFPWYDFSCFNFNWWIINEFQKIWLFLNHSFHSHTCYILFFTCS